MMAVVHYEFREKHFISMQSGNSFILTHSGPGSCLSWGKFPEIWMAITVLLAFQQRASIASNNNLQVLIIKFIN